MRKFLALLFIIGLTQASVLLTNGDFEQPLNTGWYESTSGGNAVVDRATNYDTDPDYEARSLVNNGSGTAQLWQVVNIPTTDLQFAVKAKLYAWDNNADTLCCAGAAVIISYLDESGSLLGDTKICRFSEPFPWANSSTSHLIIASNTNWNNYSFNINDELNNLSGVNPQDVKKIKITLYAKTEHTC